MDGEVLGIIILVVLGMSFLALLLLRFAGKYSKTIMYIICFLAAVPLGLISYVGTNWGEPDSNSLLLINVLLYWLLPCAFASLAHHLLVSSVKD